MQTRKLNIKLPLSITYGLDGAHNQNRTDDLILTMDALYRLSYAGALKQSQTMERVMGIEPT